jgi:hypothetical protein
MYNFVSKIKNAIVILVQLMITVPLIVLSVSICVILMITGEIKHTVKNWHVNIKSPFSSKWIGGSFGEGYFKLPIFTFIRFNAELIKLPEGAEVKLHFDKPYLAYREVPYRKYRYVKINFNLNNSEGGDFVCNHAHVNNRFFAIYEPDRQRHSFEEVSKGTKLILSLGILI